MICVPPAVFIFCFVTVTGFTAVTHLRGCIGMGFVSFLGDSKIQWRKITSNLCLCSTQGSYYVYLLFKTQGVYVADFSSTYY